LPDQLFGGEIRKFPFDDACGGLVDLIGGLGDPEVGELDGPVIRDHHILRGDIAVDDVERIAFGVAGFVGEGKGFCDFIDDGDGDRDRDKGVLLGHPTDNLAEVTAMNVLHRDVIIFTDLRDIVDLNDIRMIQTSGDPGFVEKLIDKVFVVREVRQDAFDRNLFCKAAWAGGLGAKDLRHPALPDALFKKIRTKLDRIRFKHQPLSALDRRKRV